MDSAYALRGRTLRSRKDQVIVLGSADAKVRPDHKMRLVVIEAKPHKSKGRYGGGSTGQDCDGFLRIVTNMLDVPAEIIALIYYYRWLIEIFCRCFKHLPGCRHLLSRSKNGIELQVCCAIIACMLISLWTGRKPTLRTQEMICLVLLRHGKRGGVVGSFGSVEEATRGSKTAHLIRGAIRLRRQPRFMLCP